MSLFDFSFSVNAGWVVLALGLVGFMGWMAYSFVSAIIGDYEDSTLASYIALLILGAVGLAFAIGALA